MRPIINPLVLATTLFTSLCHAHSWIEELVLLAPNGSFTSPKGYPRGLILRNETGFTDADMQWMLPSDEKQQLTKDMTLCRPSQQTSNYTNPLIGKLLAYPGAAIALRYQENGHVTLPWLNTGKPSHSGIVYVYGTNEPKKDDKLLDIYKTWTLDGKGGDGRGRLLTSQYFDDGQCYQVNVGDISMDRQARFPRAVEAGSFQGANLWCQTDVPLPKDVTVGKDYTLYWVWDWSTIDDTGKVTAPQLYTSCMDVSIADKDTVASKSGAAVPSDKGNRGDDKGNDKHDNKKPDFVPIKNYGMAAIESVFENLSASPTITETVTAVPVNYTASVSYKAANSCYQTPSVCPIAVAQASGAAAASSWFLTFTPTPTPATTTGETTTTPPATISSADSTSPIPKGPAAISTGQETTACSTTSVTITVTSFVSASASASASVSAVQTKTVTQTITVTPSQSPSKRSSLHRRRGVLH